MKTEIEYVCRKCKHVWDSAKQYKKCPKCKSLNISKYTPVKGIDYDV